MWNYTIKAEVVTGRFSRQVETFSVQAKNLTDAMIKKKKKHKIGRVIDSTSVKNKDNKIMSHYHKEEIKAVMPMYGVETYIVRIQIRTETGATKWITVPADKVEQLKSLVEGF